MSRAFLHRNLHNRKNSIFPQYLFLLIILTYIKRTIIYFQKSFFISVKNTLASRSRKDVLHTKSILSARDATASLDQGNENQERREASDSLICLCKKELITNAKWKFHSYTFIHTYKY